ncbi:MAG: DEAD/DEAH box helicase [Clostridia bacterium]|nr:DEAD/DEAH box helicase [Clostridia bacterium]
MNLAQFVQSLKRDENFMVNVECWRDLPAREARYADFPEYLDKRVALALQKRGVTKLYIHQRKAVDLAWEGKNVVVVTPTASGKTLCYNIPVLNQILSDPSSRAIYLFPTKALSSDQVSELYSMVESIGEDIKAFTYDGDTPSAARTAIRQAGHVVVTNPDMLHAGILPHHTKWVKLFENLKYVVIDEIHAYRGVFGSNLANVIRRLKRICAFYGSNPRFICCSATIANPGQLARALTGEEMSLVDENGAAAGERHVILYNPPVVNRQLGIRANCVDHTFDITRKLIKNGIQTIVFSRSRVQVEVLVRRLKDIVKDPLGEAGRVRGYRGGYLPSQRRDIERSLRRGEVDCVVSTNALELGIDIGQLEACVICGYPGTIASTWQQAGRAGRRNSRSLIIIVGSSAPLDQYIMAHGDFLFDRSPERAYINADNLYILLNHLKCAAYELPFDAGESFAGNESTGELLEYLTEENILRRVDGRFYWMAEEFPQAGINLRSAIDQNFVIIDISRADRHRVIGEMDRFTVPMLLHENAIYMSEGKQYQVEKLDFDGKKAYVRAVDVDYYTDANLVMNLKVLYDSEEKPMGGMVKHRGDVLVSTMTTLFKKMKLDTQENLGWGQVTLPEVEMHTSACWWTLPEGMEEEYGRDEFQSAMVGLGYAIRHIAPVYLMCAPGDIHVSYHSRDPFTRKPTIYLNDAVPGGLGLSDKVYEMDLTLFREALDSIKRCKCRDGCPGCVGAAVTGEGKRALIDILTKLIA